MHITRTDLENFEKRFRAHLINSLSCFKSVNVVGTRDAQGQNNLSIVSSVVHLGSDPALIGMIIRPHSVPRHTFENIQSTRQYTINHVSKQFWQAAHQTSASYAKTVSEFDAVGLSAEFQDGFTAPFVKESALKYGLNLREIIHLTVNKTELVIGEIQDIHTEESAISEDGYIDIESLDTITASGLDSYHATHRLGRLEYAKP